MATFNIIDDETERKLLTALTSAAWKNRVLSLIKTFDSNIKNKLGYRIINKRFSLEQIYYLLE